LEYLLPDMRQSDTLADDLGAVDPTVLRRTMGCCDAIDESRNQSGDLTDARQDGWRD
jgi:hypothetical protein